MLRKIMLNSYIYHVFLKQNGCLTECKHKIIFTFLDYLLYGIKLFPRF